MNRLAPDSTFAEKAKCLACLLNFFVYLLLGTIGRSPAALRAFFIWKIQEDKMAREIRETPILYGEDARRFLARMQVKRTETPEARAERLLHYEFMKKAFEEGMREKRAREAANGGVDPWFDHI